MNQIAIRLWAAAVLWMTLAWGAAARSGEHCESHADCALQLRCVGHECVTQGWIDRMEMVVGVSSLVFAGGLALIHIRAVLNMRRPRGRMDRGVPVGWHRIDRPTFRQLRQLVDCGDGVVRTECGWIRIEGRRVLMGVGVQVRLADKFPRRVRSWPLCAAIDLKRYPPTLSYRAPWIYLADLLCVGIIILGGSATTGTWAALVPPLFAIGITWVMYTAEISRFQRLLGRIPSAEDYLKRREPVG